MSKAKSYRAIGRALAAVEADYRKASNKVWFHGRKLTHPMETLTTAHLQLLTTHKLNYWTEHRLAALLADVDPNDIKEPVGLDIQNIVTMAYYHEQRDVPDRTLQVYGACQTQQE